VTFLVYSLAAPILLLPLEKLLPYPYILEELTKYFLVSLIFKNKDRKDSNNWFYVLYAGLLFTFSESILYISNIISLGRYWDFPARLLLTGTLHVSTMLIMFWGMKRGWLISTVTLLITFFIHYFFNLAISNIPF
jgi:hypothetical protein